MKQTVKAALAVTGMGVLYTQMIKPNTKRAGHSIFQAFYDKPIAHRGLHNNEGDAPENSMKSFARAVDAGYGIELDVQLTKDDKLVVFHDANMKRVCGQDVCVRNLTYEQLQAFTLCQSKEKVPLFEDVLQMVDGRVPLLVEIKYHSRVILTAKMTACMLDCYEGAYIVESFHPLILLWYRIFRPQVLRGQLSTKFLKEPEPCNPLGAVILTNLLPNFLTKPDFIAYNHKFKNQFSYQLARKLYRFEHAAWTIKNQTELNQNKEEFGILIFDSFVPEDK